MLSAYLDTSLKFSKTTYPQKLFVYECMHNPVCYLYKRIERIAKPLVIETARAQVNKLTLKI